MFHLIASAVASLGMLVHGGGMPPQNHDQDQNGSTSPRTEMHMGSTTEDHGESNKGEPAVLGKVTSVSGTSFTFVSIRPGTATTTYTVDASAAKVFKAAGTRGRIASSTTASIATGDSVIVVGTVSGTTITAKYVVDGKFPPVMKEVKKVEDRKIEDKKMEAKKGDDHMASSTESHGIRPRVEDSHKGRGMDSATSTSDHQ